MTPKEKAFDLIKEIILIDSLDKNIPIEKQFALICVDEILRNEVNTTMHPNDIIMDYWKEVKQEINKL